MARVYLGSNDPMLIIVYDKKTSDDYFGPEYLEEYGTDIPDELLERYQRNYRELFEIQKELEKYRGLHEKSVTITS